MAFREDMHVTKLRLGGNDNNTLPIIISEKAARATFTIGAEASNAITVNIQLNHYRGLAMKEACAVEVYLSSDSAGQVPEAASANLSVAAGSNGAVFELSTDNFFKGIAEADGTLDIVVTETGTNSIYLNVVFPDGSFVTSGVLAFA